MVFMSLVLVRDFGSFVRGKQGIYMLVCLKSESAHRVDNMRSDAAEGRPYKWAQRLAGLSSSLPAHTVEATREESIVAGLIHRLATAVDTQ